MKKWIGIASACSALAIAVGVVAQQSGQGPKGEAAAKAAAKSDIVDTAVAAGSFKTLAAALQAGGLVETLKGKGPFTVFAPTDEAFAKLPPGTVEALLKPENREQLKAVLTYHVVAGDVRAADVLKLTSASTVNGQRVDIAVKGGQVILDGNARVVKADIACSNGVIHVIDSVILPVQKDILQVAGEAGSFGTLAAAIRAAGLEEALKGKGPFTVFAPTDEAFAKLPPGTVEDLLKPANKEKLAAILKYHVIPGAVYADGVVKLKETGRTLQGQTLGIKVDQGKVSIRGKSSTAGVIGTDVEASNGVIHVIDTVLLPS
jgi:transforming growth factor-beta-induced protein